MPEICQNEPQAAPVDDMIDCDYCGRGFYPYRPNQRFCCNYCRRAFEAIIGRISAAVRKGIREGVRDILKVQND